MANHEIPSPANQPDFHEEARRRVLDNSGFAPIQIDQILEVPDANPDRVPYPKPHRKPQHVSHRGGRAFPEGHEDPQTALPPEKLTQEQIAERQAVLAGPGHREAVVVGALATHNALMKATAGESVSYRIARERAAQEKRARRLRGQ